MPSCNTYHLTWVSLTLDVGYLFTAAPAKRSHCSLTLDEGYLLTAALPDLQRGIAPLGPPAYMQPPLLGHGVAPPSSHLWPQAWGSSSPPLLCHRSLALLAAAPDLGHGVAPLGALVPWGQTLVEVMEIMVTSFKRSHVCTATLSAPNPAAGHHQLTSLLEAPGHSEASLGQSLVGHCSFLLGPGAQGSVCALQVSGFLSPSRLYVVTLLI